MGRPGVSNPTQMILGAVVMVVFFWIPLITFIGNRYFW